MKRSNGVKNRSIIFVICFFGFFINIFTERNSYSETVRGVTNNSLKIGVIGDMTGPGVDTWGPIADGIKTYIKYFNDQNGIHGRKVKLIVEDDRFSIPLALSAFKKLAFRDKILAVIGASGQGQTYAIIPRLEKVKLPILAILAEPTYIIPARKYIYGVLPFYNDQIKIIFNYLQKDLKAKRPKISFMYMDSASSKPIVPLVRELSKKMGASLSEIVIPIAGIDMTSEVLRLRKVEPDYVIVNGYVANTAAILRTASKFKFKKPIFVTQYGAAKTTIELARGAASILLGVNCFGSFTDKSPGMTLLRNTKQKYDPGTEYEDRNFAQGWFVGLIMNEGLKNAGRNLNVKTLIKGLNNIRNFDTRGVCGIVNLSQQDHKAIDYHKIYKSDTKKKELVPITDWRKSER
ncbi:MAG: ABC transporter substrate-binding protein [Spirochaetota bacterium]|nr:ABC transporter substrate-binding protein [Spirochaetota bacterium]